KPVRSFDDERVVSRTAFTDTLWHPEVPGWDFEKPGPGAESSEEEKGEPKEPGEGKEGKEVRARRPEGTRAAPGHPAPAASTARGRQVATSAPDRGRARVPARSVGDLSLPGPGTTQVSARSTPGGGRESALRGSRLRGA